MRPTRTTGPAGAANAAARPGARTPPILPLELGNAEFLPGLTGGAIDEPPTRDPPRRFAICLTPVPVCIVGNTNGRDMRANQL
jgi:hypothetical protein